MKKLFLVAGCWLLVTCSFAQTINQKLQKAFQQFENDGQLKYAIGSLYVIDVKTGKVVFDKNSRIGLAPASTQKIITGVTAYELLGRDFKYETNFILAKDLHLGGLYLFIHGSGDPAFGSWRFKSTSPSLILDNVFRGLQNSAPQTFFVMDQVFGAASLPDGYIWQDIGNYYGSGHYQLNWKENQYNIVFETGREKMLSKITKIDIDTTGLVFFNQVMSGPEGSGDNAYIYAAPYSKKILIQGTIPPNKKSFEISGSVPDPPQLFVNDLKSDLESRWKNIISSKKVYGYVRRGFSPNELIGMPVLGSS
ncbi:MAG TPA: D-alanyl-D-alanine carboxypeptidase, partial [Chitinophagaceae bacterium]|nr:D-alanyl-D-alanine carboxypeptidase [Chitinophagaceae bacterium]